MNRVERVGDLKIGQQFCETAALGARVLRVYSREPKNKEITATSDAFGGVVRFPNDYHVYVAERRAICEAPVEANVKGLWVFEEANNRFLRAQVDAYKTGSYSESPIFHVSYLCDPDTVVTPPPAPRWISGETKAFWNDCAPPGPIKIKYSDKPPKTVEKTTLMHVPKDYEFALAEGSDSLFTIVKDKMRINEKGVALTMIQPSNAPETADSYQWTTWLPLTTPVWITRGR